MTTPLSRGSTALLTDHYELTMLQAALAAGTAHRRSVFELFPRRLPDGRRYGVVAGVGRVLDAIEAFRFDDEVLGVLREHKVVDEPTLEWLAGYRFSGDVWGYPEGEVYLPYSPLLTVEASFAEAVLLETVLLSILNHDSAIASAASRMTWAANGRPCIEMGSRRTHEEAAVAAARAAYVAGFATTSNLAARQRYGVPTAGTSAHSFTLLHDSEREAFTAQVHSLGRGTSLLVDTYDVAEAVKVGIDVAGTELGAVRIDSGDLGVLAKAVREQLDVLGATDTRVIVTSDLDEFSIAGLAAAPVDGYGVGTSLVTGSGHPTCGFVYKLVAREGADGGMVSVAKRSKDKISIGGRKYALRRLGKDGRAEAEIVGIGEQPADDSRASGTSLRADPGGSHRDLLVPLVRDGEVVGREDLATMRERHERSRAELPLRARQLSRGEPVIPTEHVGG
ncbi:MAG: nicotinate phosphoribosyltransferase [Nocardioidaceae bacterium]